MSVASSQTRGFSLIHRVDIIKRIKAHIAAAKLVGDEAGVKRLEILLMEFED